MSQIESTENVNEILSFDQETTYTTETGRAWRFTLNNYTDDEEASLKVLQGVKYMVFGHEIAPTTLTPHLQGYVYFKDKKSLKTLKKINTRISWRNANASAEANRRYCTKEDTGSFFETGIPPMDNKQKGKAGGDTEIERYEQAWAAAIAGDLNSVPVDIRIKCYRTLKEIKKDYMPKGQDLDQLNNLWIWGPAGCGKSTTARRQCNNEFYPKQMNKWWDGYQNEEVVIIDDFEKESHLGHHLKIWADHFSFLAETKGGMLQIRPKRIIITSNYSPHDCFPEEELQKAILRRFQIQRMGDSPRTFPHFEPYSLFNGVRTPVTPYISNLVIPNTPEV